MILPVTGSWMLEDTAAELLSSPQTNALAPFALKVGRSFWANVKDIEPRTTSATAYAHRMVPPPADAKPDLSAGSRACLEVIVSFASLRASVSVSLAG